MAARKPPRSVEQRLAQWMRSMSPGTLNGRVSNAAPLAVDSTRLDQRLRQIVPPGGWLDPNENPVIIGEGSTAGAGSTPSNPALGGMVSNVAIGNGAQATGSMKSVAIGNSAQASALDTVAIGDGPIANATDTIAIGHFPGATAQYAIAVGSSASASAQYAVAVGTGAAQGDGAVAIGKSATAVPANATALGPNTNVPATYTHSTAVGADARSTAANQVTLGTATDTVHIPGNLVVDGTSTGTGGGGGTTASTLAVQVALVVPGDFHNPNVTVAADSSGAWATLAAIPGTVLAAGAFSAQVSAPTYTGTLQVTNATLDVTNAGVTQAYTISLATALTVASGATVSIVFDATPNAVAGTDLSRSPDKTQVVSAAGGVYSAQLALELTFTP